MGPVIVVTRNAAIRLSRCIPASRPALADAAGPRLKAAIDKMRAAAHFPDLRLLFDKRASYLHSLVNGSRSATNRSVPPCQPHAHA